jgi:hypothetical protein
MIVGMTDETPKPKRKRRRWIIAGVWLFVVAGWWNWPRGDARLVGTWQQSISDGRTAVPVWKVTYFRDGTMSFDNKEQQRVWPFGTWRIEGARLIWGWRLPLPDSAITKWLTKKVRALPGMANWGRELAADIIKMTDHEVQFVIPKEAGTDILTRIPE